MLVHTDDGVTGLGETFLGAGSVAAWVHENAAPYLLGKDPLAIEAHWHGLRGFVGINSSRTENRGRSAIDIALWDLFGKVTGQPLYQLLGGAVRTSIPVYNTCAGPYYARDIPIAGEVSTNNWQLPDGQQPHPYEDMQAFLDRPEALARDLVDHLAVALARHSGTSWADIGRAAGMARQSAQERWRGVDGAPADGGARATEC